MFDRTLVYYWVGSLFLFFLFGVVGYLRGVADPSLAEGMIAEAMEFFSFFIELPHWGLFLAIFLNNAIKAFLAVFLGLLPHGVFELGAIFLATALGFRVGVQSFFVVFRKGKMEGVFAQSMKMFFRVVLPVLFFAALVEVYVTGALIG
jgi:uncharacterized membrane protein SpoIIM required for sporulation